MEINTTIFASYHDSNSKLQKINMSEMKDLISSEQNKEQISCWIYHRLYDRFLKPFFFEEELGGYQQLREIYQKQYKHGFAIMTNCCLLIETLAGFINGENETKKDEGVKAYKKVFEIAKNYDNELKIFENKPLYGAIRCGLLHQGETKESFKIKRSGKLLWDDKKTINATNFAKELKSFIKSYCDELKGEPWDSNLWDNCRRKIRFIIDNSSKEK